jgi:hypothetical protein
MYMAWLCYPHTYDLDDNEPEIKFSEPESWMYDKILPIQFNILHRWSDKDKKLYINKDLI